MAWHTISITYFWRLLHGTKLVHFLCKQCWISVVNVGACVEDSYCAFFQSARVQVWFWPTVTVWVEGREGIKFNREKTLRVFVIQIKEENFVNLWSNFDTDFKPTVGNILCGCHSTHYICQASRASIWFSCIYRDLPEEGQWQDPWTSTGIPLTFFLQNKLSSVLGRCKIKVMSVSGWLGSPKFWTHRGTPLWQHSPVGAEFTPDDAGLLALFLRSKRHMLLFFKVQPTSPLLWTNIQIKW